MFDVKEVSDIEIVFPAEVSHLMPKWEDIPDEFKHHNRTKWNKIFSNWFYSGLKNMKVTPNPGIDKDKALRHIKAIMGSFEPKHEHKEASIAYLMSLWFEDITYDN